MWDCPHCDKTFAHHSSRRRHVLAVHTNMGKNFDSDNESNDADEDIENEELEDQACENAWNKLILDVLERLIEHEPGITRDRLLKDDLVFDVTIPAVMKVVKKKLEEAECLRTSELCTALEEEKEKLMDGGMDEWEASMMAQSNRRYLILQQIAKANLSDKEED